MKRLALMLTLLGAATLQAAAPPHARKRSVPLPTTAREVLDVRYAPGAGGRHKLDLFVPQPETGKRPVVLFVHGGTWMIGDKNFFGIYRGVGRHLAKNGVVCVSINYRLSPLVKHPEHVKDVARAYAWVRQNIHRYGGDPDCIFLAGHSAGAHLISLLALDDGYLKNPGLGHDAKSVQSLKGVIAMSGVYRIPDPDEFKKIARHTVDTLVGEPEKGRVAASMGAVLMLFSGAANPFNVVFGKSRDVQTQASPITHVRRGLPPFLMFNAEREVPGLWKMAEDFFEALKKHEVCVEWHEIEGATHRTIVKWLHSGENDVSRKVLAFIALHAG